MAVDFGFSTTGTWGAADSGTVTTAAGTIVTAATVGSGTLEVLYIKVRNMDGSTGTTVEISDTDDNLIYADYAPAEQGFVFGLPFALTGAGLLMANSGTVNVHWTVQKRLR